MTDTPVAIHKTTFADMPALRSLYAEAFPEEDLWPLVQTLVDGHREVISLGAFADGVLVGHGCVTLCGVTGQTGPAGRAALLGPLGVRTAWQKRGIGRALIEFAAARLRELGVPRLQVLGDPGYYGRAGFTADDRVATPYQLPAEWRAAWQVRALDDNGAEDVSGTLDVPPYWRDPALWGP